MLWFMDTLVTFPAAHEEGSDGISVIESLAPQGRLAAVPRPQERRRGLSSARGRARAAVTASSPPTRARRACSRRKASPVPTRVMSEQARWLVITTHGDFERFVREVSRPATVAALPAPGDPPTPEQQHALGQLSLRHGIELIGPPLADGIAQAA